MSRCNPPCAAGEVCGSNGECWVRGQSRKLVRKKKKLPSAERHDGTYLRLGLLAGAGTHTLDHPRLIQADEGEGMVRGFDMAIGGTLGAGVVLAFELQFLTQGQSTVNADSEWMHPALHVVWYPDPTGGVSMGLSWGPSIGKNSKTDELSDDVFGETDRESGTNFAVLVGYDTFISDEWSVGAAARLSVMTESVDAAGFSYNAVFGLVNMYFLYN